MSVVVVGSCYVAATSVCHLWHVFECKFLSYSAQSECYWGGGVVAIHLSFPKLLNNFYEIWYWFSKLNLLGGAFCFGLLNTKLKYSVFVREVTFLRIWARNIELLFLRLYSFYLEDYLDAVNSDSWNWATWLALPQQVFLSTVNHKVIADMHSDRTFGIYEGQSKRNAS